MLRHWLYTCVCVCMGTLHPYCVWLMHRDTLAIKSEEINIPFPFLSVISSFAPSHFLNPRLPRLVFCRHRETLRHVVAFGRSFTIKFARQKKQRQKGERERERASQWPSCINRRVYFPPLPAGLFLFVHSNGTKMKHCALVYTLDQNWISPSFPSQGPLNLHCLLSPLYFLFQIHRQSCSSLVSSHKGAFSRIVGNYCLHNCIMYCYHVSHRFPWDPAAQHVYAWY